LDQVTFAKAWAEGRALLLEQAIEYALEPLPREEVSHPQTPRQAAKQAFGGLTERERQVAALIAQGASNHEIAEALVVSERTVESHVTNILSKLGFTARTQIAAWAVEKGLVRQKQ
jgi:non-specific serine/threonine protein kinase